MIISAFDKVMSVGRRQQQISGVESVLAGREFGHNFDEVILSYLSLGPGLRGFSGSQTQNNVAGRERYPDTNSS